ncbi:uncharacterized protein LOC120105078 [Phoenix dactylifera]|uniref:Uncharacterized protein LOC120105078 n=1 Tax=Phoenix dactylifera TaxID=42345 RepID=A0A8B8ZFZ7_PHODC|nr:uncharacterized protein LOC120105078 [Phoenix dactylifera]
MADNQDNQNKRLLSDYAVPNINGAQSSIVRPTINANNFEIKLGLIQMVQQEQFGGAPAENPHAHLANFLEICDTIKMNGVSDDAIRLRLFPFSLKDKAKAWLNSKAPNSFTTWNALSQIFLSKYFPSVRITIDAAAGGTLMSKSTEEVYKLLEEMASNNYQWSNERGMPKKVPGMYDVDGINILNAKVQFVSNYNKQQKQNNPYSNTYNPGWRNHPNFSWKDQGNQGSSSRPLHPPGFQPRPSQPESKQSWEIVIEKLANASSERFERLEAKLYQLPSKTEVNPKEHCKAVTLRSGKQLGKVSGETIVGDEVDYEEVSKKFEKFLKVFRQLYINIPFADALAQIPVYTKFLKEIMSKKRKLEDFETIALTEECSAIIHNKLPPKLRDPWSFSILKAWIKGVEAYYHLFAAS